MICQTSNTPALAAPQRGAALVVALILLVVVTLMGISGMQNTALQERMSGNMFDRSIAMQAAEAGLRAAETELELNNDAIQHDCRPDSDEGPPEDNDGCAIETADTFSGNDANWQPVADEFLVNTDLSAGRPEFLIQLIYQGEEPGADQTAGLSDAALQYGSGLSNRTPSAVRIYRVTARSQAPDANTNRAIVVLQTTVRRVI